MERSSSYQLSSAKNFKVAPRFVEILWNPAAYISRSKLVHLLTLAPIIPATGQFTTYKIPELFATSSIS
jgi:hypothetical protein